jgi:hypothetical protein
MYITHSKFYIWIKITMSFNNLNINQYSNFSHWMSKMLFFSWMVKFCQCFHFCIIANSSLVSTKLYNPTTSPTSIGMPGSYEGLATTLLKLFQYFTWFHVTLIRDSSVTTEFYLEIFRATQLLAVSKEQSDFRIDGFSFTPANRLSIDEALAQASRRSRGDKYSVFYVQHLQNSWSILFFYSVPDTGSYFGGHSIAGKNRSQIATVHFGLNLE